MVQGENAWVFVNEECIAESVKSYHDFEKKLLEKYPKEQRKDMHPTAITGKHPAGLAPAHHSLLAQSLSLSVMYSLHHGSQHA